MILMLFRAQLDKILPLDNRSQGLFVRTHLAERGRVETTLMVVVVIVTSARESILNMMPLFRTNFVIVRESFRRLATMKAQDYY